MKILFGVLLSIATTIANAEVVFQGRIQSGIQDYDFTLSNVRPLNPGAETVAGRTPQDVAQDVTIDVGYEVLNEAEQTSSDTITVLGLGGTAIFESGFYLDLYYQKGLDGEQAQINKDGTSGILTNISSIDIDREDYAISLGKALGQFSLAGGYKSGSTDFSQSFTSNESSGAVPAILSSSFELDGPFASVAWTKSFTKGSLSFNFAVADLSGEFSISRRRVDLSADVRTFLSGDATGTTFGVNWSADINDAWSYSVGTDYYNYDFDVAGNSGQDREGTSAEGSLNTPISANIEEELFALKVNLKYTF